MVFGLPADGAAPDREKLEAAHQKCKHLMPDGGDLPKPDPAQVESMRQFAKCMRANGVPNFPDPEPDGKIKIQSFAGVDRDDPAFRAALEKCRQYRPTPPSGAAGR